MTQTSQNPQNLKKSNKVKWLGFVASFVVAYFVVSLIYDHFYPDRSTKTESTPDQKTQGTPAAPQSFSQVSETSSVVYPSEPAPSGQKNQLQDRGDFKIRYEETENESFLKWRKALKDEKALETIAEGLNKTFNLPFDIEIISKECGQANAFYDPNQHQIQICYEYLEESYKLFKKGADLGDEEEVIYGRTFNDFIFTFYHELGHALIDIFDLPITGREEDVVDQLSTYILTDGTDESEAAALDGAARFYLDESELEDSDLSDEHSLNHQRLYNVLCWVYGQNPEKHADLVKEELLPEARADRCPQEYQRLEKAWETLLGPYLKEQQ